MKLCREICEKCVCVSRKDYFSIHKNSDLKEIFNNNWKDGVCYCFIGPFYCVPIVLDEYKKLKMKEHCPYFLEHFLEDNK